MISLAVDMKRRPTLLHFPLAVHAFHESLLIRNPESHSSVSGTYVGARAASVPMSRGALWARQALMPNATKLSLSFCSRLRLWSSLCVLGTSMVVARFPGDKKTACDGAEASTERRPGAFAA